MATTTHHSECGKDFQVGQVVRLDRTDDYTILTGKLVRIELDGDEATYWVQWDNNTSGPDAHGPMDITPETALS